MTFADKLKSVGLKMSPKAESELEVKKFLEEEAKKGKGRSSQACQLHHLRDCETVTEFKATAKMLLLQGSETGEEVVRIAHQKFPKNVRLHALVFKLRDGLKKVRPEFKEQLINRFMSKATNWDIPSEWLK